MKTDASWLAEQDRKIHECGARAQRLRAEQRRLYDPGYLYVVEFDFDVVKVGKAVNVEHRLRQHSKVAPVRSSWASARHLHCSKTERRLIAFCNEHGTVHTGREYFRDLDLAAVRAYADTIVRDARRRTYITTLIEAVDGDLTATWQHAHQALVSATLERDPEEGDDLAGLVDERDVERIIDRNFGEVVAEMRRQPDMSLQAVAA